jgi:hypothetical protein
VTSAAYLGQAWPAPFTAYVLGTAVDTRPIRLVVLRQLPLPRVHAQDAPKSLSHRDPLQTPKHTAMRASRHRPLSPKGVETGTPTCGGKTRTMVRAAPRRDPVWLHVPTPAVDRQARRHRGQRPVRTVGVVLEETGCARELVELPWRALDGAVRLGELGLALAGCVVVCGHAEVLSPRTSLGLQSRRRHPGRPSAPRWRGHPMGGGTHLSARLREEGSTARGHCPDHLERGMTHCLARRDTSGTRAQRGVRWHGTWPEATARPAPAS